MTTSTFERVTKHPLRMLTRIGGAELTDKLGLRRPTERVLHDVGKMTTHAVSALSALASDSKQKPPARLSTHQPSARFDLRPTDDQQMLRDAARRFAEEVLRPAAREGDDATTPPKTVLDRATELALAGLAVPEAYGGVAEASAITTSAILIEELARGDMGLALAMLAPIGVINAIVSYGTHDQQSRILPIFTADRFVPAALALLESRPRFDPTEPRTGAVRCSRSGGWTLYGEKTLVPLATTAEIFLVGAEVRGAGTKLFLVERTAPGLTVEATPAMGLRGAGLGRLHFDAVDLPANALLGGDAAAFDVADTVDRARIAWAAMAVGGARAVLEYVVPYVNERKAFGEPIAHRQAVAFMVADLAIELEALRLMVHRACALADSGENVTRYASMLRAHASTYAMKAGTDGVQLLGGHGFVADHPVELWYRDLRAIGVMEGALLA